ncbi:type II toxin-antitoxin system RelE/ParE family toxin [Cedecea neteri]|uniref:type II toxin-antitoxin system RelE/ParE family toxin n=1 Tax=Cedecea neteri TaxID=158822 RepID=UPI0028A1FA89|nr:type II toxin-antitoxin system RelE/ParE family toxin [Cedecea neteri]
MWSIKMTDTFDAWFTASDDATKACVIASMVLLKSRGPLLSRPYADTVRGSQYANMKELRVQCKGEPLRLFFAFDIRRCAILLCAGNKVGNEKQFYDVMIPRADKKFASHLKQLTEKEQTEWVEH